MPHGLGAKHNRAFFTKIIHFTPCWFFHIKWDAKPFYFDNPAARWVYNKDQSLLGFDLPLVVYSLHQCVFLGVT